MPANAGSTRTALSLFLVLALAVSAPAVLLAAEFGETGIGSDYVNDLDYKVFACKATCGVDGTVTSISLHVIDVKEDSWVDVALYSNTNTAGGEYPRALLTTSAAVPLTDEGWYTCPVTPTTVRTGERYWLAFRTDDLEDRNGVTCFPNTGDPGRTRVYSSTWGTDYPTLLYPDSPLTSMTCRFSLYATVMTFTPTPTATRTRTAVPTHTVTPLRSPTPTCTTTPVRSPAPTATLVPTLQPGLRADLNERTLIVYPIPVRSGPLSLTFLAPAPGRADFVIYNSAYQVVDRFSREVPAAGPRTETWPSDPLAPGMYLCRLTLDTDAGRTVFPIAKFVVVK